MTASKSKKKVKAAEIAEDATSAGRHSHRPTQWAVPESVLSTKAFQAVTKAVPGVVGRARIISWPAGFERSETSGADKISEGCARWVAPLVGSCEIFWEDGEVFVLEPGSLWEIDFVSPHTQMNTGSEPAVYLAVDVLVDQEEQTDDQADEDDQNPMMSSSGNGASQLDEEPEDDDPED